MISLNTGKMQMIDIQSVQPWTTQKKTEQKFCFFFSLLSSLSNWADVVFLPTLTVYTPRQTFGSVWKHVWWFLDLGGGWRKVLGGGPAAGSQWQKLGIFLITQQYTGQSLCPTHQRILQSRLSVIPPWDTLVAMAFISSYRILLVVPFWTS